MYGPVFVKTWVSLIQGCFVPMRIFFYFVDVVRYFVIISSLKRPWSFFWKVVNPFTQGFLSWFWRENSFKCCPCIFGFSLLSPVWKAHVSYSEKQWIHLPFVPSLIEIGPVVLEKWQCKKTDRRTIYMFINKFY